MRMDDKLAWQAGLPRMPLSPIGRLEDGLPAPSGISVCVTIHDLHATMLHLLGIDHTKLTYRFGGRDMRLTDVRGELVGDIVG